MMLPRLMAEESMREAERIGIGMGRLRPDAGRRILRAWQQDAQRSSLAQRQASPADLGGMGIGYQVIGKKTTDGG